MNKVTFSLLAALISAFAPVSIIAFAESSQISNICIIQSDPFPYDVETVDGLQKTLEALGQMSPDELRDAMTLFDIRDNLPHETTFKYLVSLHMQNFPEEDFSAILSDPNHGFYINSRANEIGQKLIENMGVEAALKATEEWEYSGHKRAPGEEYLKRGLSRYVHSLEKEEALALFFDKGDDISYFDGEMIRSLYLQWRREDIEKAVDHFTSQKNSYDRLGVVPRLFPTLMEKDHRAALDWLSTRSDLEQRDALRSFASGFRSAEIDFDILLGYLKELPPGSFKKNLAGTTFALMPVENPQQTLEWITENLERSYQAEPLSSFVRKLIQKDLMETLVFIESIPDKQDQKRVISGIRHNLPREQLLQFFEMRETLSEDIYSLMRGPFILRLSGYASFAHIEGIKLFESSDDPEVKSALASGLAKYYASHDFDQALKWLEHVLPDSKKRVEGNILSTYVKLNPGEVLKHLWEVETLLERSRKLSHLVGNLSSIMPEETAALVMTLSPGQATRSLLETVGGNWVAVDKEGFVKWIDSLEAGKVKDGALKTLFRRTPSEDMDERLKIAVEVNDQSSRRYLLYDTLKPVWEKDPSEAYRILEELNIPDEEKKKVRERWR